MHAIDGMACAKRGCDNRGKLGLNIVGHGSFPTKWGRRWRYRCTVCGGTVSTNSGTAYSGLRCARREFDQVASLRVEGVSMSATARVTGHARKTIARWLERASPAAKRFNQRLLRDFEIIELPADELCTFIGNKSSATWLCAAIEVCSRLWAGSVLGRRASRNATAVLNDVILRGRVVGCPLIATEGFEYDVGVSERLFGSACVYGHVLKTRRNDRVVRTHSMWRSYAVPLPSSSCTLAQPRCHRSRGRTNTDRLPDQQRMAQAPIRGHPTRRPRRMTSLIAALVLRWERRPRTLPAHKREHTSIVANSHRVRRLLPMNVQRASSCSSMTSKSRSSR